MNDQELKNEQMDEALDNEQVDETLDDEQADAPIDDEQADAPIDDEQADAPIDDEQLDKILYNEELEKILDNSDSDFVELTDEMMEKIAGGTYHNKASHWIDNPNSLWYYKKNFTAKKVWRVDTRYSGSALTMRKRPIDQNWTIVGGYYWHNGNTIYVNLKVRNKLKAGWSFCYHENGYYGYVKSHFIKF